MLIRGQIRPQPWIPQILEPCVADFRSPSATMLRQLREAQDCDCVYAGMKQAQFGGFDWFGLLRAELRVALNLPLVSREWGNGVQS